MTEYSKIAQGSFLQSSQLQVINLPFIPDYVRVQGIFGTNNGSTPTGSVNSLIWVSCMNQGDGIVSVKQSGGYFSDLAAAPNGITTFSAGLSNQFGLPVGIASITKAGPALVTTTAPHGYQVGAVVILSGISGMNQMAGIPLVITTVPSTTSFTVLWNTNLSNYTAISGSPTGAFVKQVLYPFLYQPGNLIVENVALGATTAVITTTPHNFVVGQEVAFRMPAVWGATQLNSLPNNGLPGSPNYAYVTQIVSTTQFVVNVNSIAFTPFSLNVVYAAGLNFPQVCAVGDVNTGGWPITSGSVLYPPPVINGVNTVNGPAIQGAFVNNTRMGFTIGSSILGSGGIGASTFFWQAEAHDYLQYNSVGVAVG